MSIGIKVLIRFCSLCNFIFQIFRKEKKARKIKITQNCTDHMDKQQRICMFLVKQFDKTLIESHMMSTL